MAKQKIEDVEDLAELVATNLNKVFKNQGKVAYVGADVDNPSEFTEFVSTGCTSLDLSISNRPHGGLPFGRIVELSGLEGSGKSLIAAHVMANTQKMGGVAVLIDTEAAVNWDFFEAVGVNRQKNFVYVPVATVEEIFESVESIVTSIREKSRTKPVTIVIDSIAGASSKSEMEATFDKQGYNTAKSQIIGMALRKLTVMLANQKILLLITNQLRQKMNAMPFSDPWVTPGGKAVAFHSTVRVRLSLAGTIQRKTSDAKETIGVKVNTKVVKNRVGPPYRTAEFDIYFDRGIDDKTSWLKFLRDKDIITGKANGLTYESNNGKSIKFTEAEWTTMLADNPEVEQEIYTKVCDTYIMSYSTDNVGADEIEYDDGTIEE